MHVHILGICGTFMASLAILAKELGYKVTGCDFNIYPPMSQQLKNANIEIINGFKADQIKLKPDIYIIGNIVSRFNNKFPLMEEILNQNLLFISGPQWLKENILKDYYILAVAGTHGKTTVSSILAFILDKANLNPGFLIGGIPLDFNISARLGKLNKNNKNNKNNKKLFVIEADEYDTAFFDKRSKFLHYKPNTLILNNLEFDHADIFDNLSDIEKQFKHLIRIIPNNGQIIFNNNEESLKRVLNNNYYSKLISFGKQKNKKNQNNDDYYINNLNNKEFEILKNNKIISKINWALTGEHNQLNALASILAANQVGVPIELSSNLLQDFTGVAKRMELKGEVNKIKVFDDFAHHPTAIKETLKGFKSLNKENNNSRILVVFEPRSNTMKLGSIKSQLKEALNLADKVFCYNRNINWNITEILPNAIISNDINNLINLIIKEAKQNDNIICMSNGHFEDIHNKILNRL